MRLSSAFALLAFLVLIDPASAQQPSRAIEVNPGSGAASSPQIQVLPAPVEAPDSSAAPATASPAVETDPGAQRDYEAAERIGTKEAYEAFLTVHPSGFHAELARLQITKLGSATPPPAAPVSPAQAAKPPAAAAPPDAGDVARLLLLQTHLKRVGCDPGVATGRWGPESGKALAAFNRNAGTNFDVNAPGHEVLDVVRAKTGRICPLICQTGFREDGERCVEITCKRGFVRGDGGDCVPKPEPERAAKPEPQPTRKTLREERHRPARVERNERRQRHERREPPRRAASGGGGGGKVLCTDKGCRSVAGNCRVVSSWGTNGQTDRVVCN